MGRAAAEPSRGVPDEVPTIADSAWMDRALESMSDAVYVLDAATQVRWANSAGAALVGLSRQDVIGRSIADYVHPGDLARAAEVLGLASAGVFNDLPITPALYRVRNGEGDWVSVGVNASLPQSDGSVVVIARAGGDLVILDRLLEAATANAPFDQQVEIVLDLARWRHPLEGYVIRYDDFDGTRRSIGSSGLDPLLSGDEYVREATPWAKAVLTGTDVVVTNLHADGLDDEVIGPMVAAAAQRSGFAGCVAAPVPDPNGDHDACIVIWATEYGPTNAGHGYALDNMRRALALVLQQRAQRVMLERAARTDALTGLWSRAGFFELIEDDTTGRLAAGFDIAYIDLDGFKAVNDSFGHTIGDHVLVAASQRIQELAPSGSIVARLGGDEFVLASPSSLALPSPSEASSSDAEALAQRIVDALAEPLETAAGMVTVGASIGLASGQAGQVTQPILEAADEALLAAKASGRSRWVSA